MSKFESFFTLYGHWLVCNMHRFSDGQVFRSRMDSDTSLSSQRPKVNTGLSSTYTSATLGRNTSSRVNKCTLSVVHPVRFLQHSRLASVLGCLNINNGIYPYFLFQSPVMMANSTGSLPRNLAATLQDIEIKRQLALQQKGTTILFCSNCSARNTFTQLASLLWQA